MGYKNSGDTIPLFSREKIQKQYHVPGFLKKGRKIRGMEKIPGLPGQTIYNGPFFTATSKSMTPETASRVILRTDMNPQ